MVRAKAEIYTFNYQKITVPIILFRSKSDIMFANIDTHMGEATHFVSWTAGWIEYNHNPEANAFLL